MHSLAHSSTFLLLLNCLFYWHYRESFPLLPAEISTVICDNQTKAETLLQTREKGQTPVLKTIVIMDAFSSELVERGAKCGVDIVSMQDVEVMHAER